METKKNKRSPLTESVMRDIFLRYDQSKLPVKEFCRENNISIHCWYWWRKRLGLKIKSYPGKSCRKETVLPQFIRVRGSNFIELSCYELALTENRQLRIPVNFEEDSLRRLISVLQTC